MAVIVNAFVLVMLVSGIYFCFRAFARPCSFGYKGLSFYYFGRRIWKLTNRVFGIFLIVGSLIFFAIQNIWDQNVTQTEATYHLYLLLGYMFVSFVITDIIAFMKMLINNKNKKNKAKSC
ncbi:hypothetical protein I6N95_11870 [Vagococcus sp. BWB3-3]|uniref:Uncharacterized protein n=1 Tax=Vagococcus allomyrinae TaxID=2794353 RepID=A0A940PDW3_9ENTE|nr:hypothetical protein [Vagococcus allomyrinae]MBP1041706.1 hypothetical protein [Vagococcus allomyrinae]